MINVAIEYKGAVNQLGIQDELTKTISESFLWLDQYIVFKGTIDVEVNIEETSTGRFSGTGTVHDFLGAQDGLKIWEHTAITESRTGIDVNPFSPEFIINIDPYSNYLQKLWWDPTPSTLSPDEIPGNKTDAFSVVLHEILHGMGISGWLDWETGEHFGNNQSVWDSHILIENGKAYFTGNHVIEFTGKPVEVRLGGSQGAYHLGSINSEQPFLESSIMNSYYFRLGERYLPTELEFAILEDLGWTLKDSSTLTANNEINQLGTPENDFLIGLDGDDTLNGYDGDDIIDGGKGNDILIGGPGDDLLKIGHGFDELTGGEGKDNFTFYAPGHFVIHDFNKTEDLLVFDSGKTGIHSTEELLSIIDVLEYTDKGTIVHFIDDIASITLIGLHSDDISTDFLDYI